MHKKSPKKATKGKPGPKEERLRIADPQAAVDFLVKKKPARK